MIFLEAGRNKAEIQNTRIFGYSSSSEKKTWRKCKQHKKLIVLYTFLITTRRCLPSYAWMYACLSQMMIKGLAFLSYARLHFLTSLVSLMKRRCEKFFFRCVFTYVGGYIKEWGIDLQSEENPLLTQRRVGWIGYKYMQYIPASVVDSMLIKLNVGSPSFSSSLNFFELNSRLYKFLVGFSFSICFKTSTFPVVVIDAILSTCGEEVNSKRV